MSAPPRSLRTYVFLGLGVASFTLAPILVRWADDAPGLTIAVWRTVVAAVVLAPVAWRSAAREIQQLPRRDLLGIGVAGVLLGTHFIAWIESLYHTSVASASVLVTSSPIFVALVGYVFLRERLSAATVGAIVVGVMGAGLIGWADAGSLAVSGGATFGNALALGAAVLVGLYLIIGRVVRQGVSWLAYVAPLYAVTALTTLVFAVVQDTPLLGHGWTVYACAAALALGPQILGHGSFNYALQSMPAAIVGMLALFEPVGASILAYLLFGEVPPLTSVAGMAIVLASVGFVVWTRRRSSGEAES